MHALTEMAEAEPQRYLLLLRSIASSIHRPEIAQCIQELFARLSQGQAATFKKFHKEGTYTQHDPLIFVDLLHSFALNIMMGRAFLGIDVSCAQLAEEANNMFQFYMQTYLEIPTVPSTNATARLE